MWRYLAGAASAVLAMGAGYLLLGQGSKPATQPIPAAVSSRPLVAPSATASPVSAPSATARTREEKRFDRYDKNRDEAITVDELLATRRKAFAKLDVDHDGKLSFREWAHTTYDKFAKADADKSGKLTRAEFATTKRKTKPKPKCSCK